MSQDETLRLLAACHCAIRDGETAAAVSLLRKLKPKDVPRSRLAEYAALLRRLNQNEQSVTVLKPKIYPKLKSAAPASSAEVVEYALALQRLGARRESRRLLQTVDAAAEPKALMALASQHVFEWDYAAARPLYDQALAAGRLSEYELFVCQVNRLACLGRLSDPAFDSEFEKLQSALSKVGYHLLLGNILEIRAQVMVHLRRWPEAQTALDTAGHFLKSENSYGQLFVQKWSAIAEALRKGMVKPLDRLRELALKGSDWETLRHVDFYRTMIAPRDLWADWVYYGTPYRAFRAGIEKMRDFPEEQWIMRNPKAKVEFDPWFIDGVPHGDVCHRLLVFLLSDLYRPFAVGEIASELFSTRHFDLDSSKNRVHKLVQRGRKWIADHGLPVRLERVGGLYTIRLDENVRMKCRRRAISVSRSGFIFGRYAQFEEKPLGLEEWSKILKCTPSQTRRTLNLGITDALIKKSGTSRYTRYQLVAQDPKEL